MPAGQLERPCLPECEKRIRDSGHQERKTLKLRGKSDLDQAVRVSFPDKMKEMLAIDRRTDRKERSAEGRDYSIL